MNTHLISSNQECRGNKPHQISTTISEQDVTPDSRIDSSTAPQQQSKRNTSKRPKEGDDSFEFEHRLVNLRNQYFNSSDSRHASSTSTTTTRTSSNITNPSSSSSRPSFPPFRLNFAADETPSELSIIKNINKHCSISLSYGRYTSMNRKKSFLLYANSSEQFDRLMDRNIWPVQIDGIDLTIDFPSKVPSSYSIVATGVPAQWNLSEFEEDIKKQYPTIIKVERLYIKGGLPISKVRIDFSSNQEVNKIIKNKRLLLDDDNTSFAIQPYSPPLKILRCFNCQQYNDHIAANCPHKENPVCFRCGQNHPYNPQCLNKICCANCHQEHMAGNPNCPTKIEERKKCQINIMSSNFNKQKQDNSSTSVWTVNGNKRINHINHNRPPSPMVNVGGGIDHSDRGVGGIDRSDRGIGGVDRSNRGVGGVDRFDRDGFMDISNKLDLLMLKVEHLSIEQTKINSSINNVNQLINQSHQENKLMKEFILNKLCPYVCQLSETFLGKCKPADKDKLRPLFIQFNQGVKDLAKLTKHDQRSPVTLPNSSSNESISDQF